jgi:hypothetical protein
MKIRIKTTLIEIEIEDEPKVSSDGCTRRSVPDLPICIKSAIDEAIRLHKEVSVS